MGLEDLPQTPITGARLQLDGGNRGLVLNPRRCGRYDVGVRFASHAGAVVERRFPIEVDGCAATPAIAGVAVAPRRVTAGRSARLSWRLSGAATTQVTLLERSRGRGWRSLGTAAAAASPFTIGPRWRGRRLRPGRYRIALRALAADGAVSRERTAALRITAH